MAGSGRYRRARSGIVLIAALFALSACDFQEGDQYLDGRNGNNPGVVTIYSEASAEIAWIYNEECNDDGDCFRAFLEEKFLEDGNLDERGRLVIQTIIDAGDWWTDRALDGWSVNTGDCIEVLTIEAGPAVQPQLYRKTTEANRLPRCRSGGESTITGYSYD